MKLRIIREACLQKNGGTKSQRGQRRQFRKNGGRIENERGRGRPERVHHVVHSDRGVARANNNPANAARRQFEFIRELAARQ